MKFSLALIANGSIDSWVDERQFKHHGNCVKANWPDARILSIGVHTEQGRRYTLEGEDGTTFAVEVEPVYDGSERAATEAIGRKLDDRDFGKTATEIVQADDARREKHRD